MNLVKTLDQLRVGEQAKILSVNQPTSNSQHHIDLQRRLLEMGFDEGVHVRLLHVAPFGQDVLAVEIDGAMTVAIRKQDAIAITCESEMETSDTLDKRT